MKVLFVSREKTGGKMSPIVASQKKSLLQNGITIDSFLFRGNGFRGYLNSILPLRKKIQDYNPDLVHAHYSISGFFSMISGAKLLLVSLMGSDLKRNSISLLLIKVFQKYFWASVIVKSPKMKKLLGSPKVHIIPNGVDLSEYMPLDKNYCQRHLNWNSDRTHILFAANPQRDVKNYKLFQKSLYSIKENFPEIEVHFLQQIPTEEVKIYLNAADVVCLSSKNEGSPNVIKEAMACNRPVVSTDVGDVKWVFGETDGCFISSKQEVDEYAEALYEALTFTKTKKATTGRERIIYLELDSKSIANNIIRVYKNLSN